MGTTADNGFAFEREAISSLALTEDSREGMLAFSEKTGPCFQGPLMGLLLEIAEQNLPVT